MATLKALKTRLCTKRALNKKIATYDREERRTRNEDFPNLALFSVLFLPLPQKIFISSSGLKCVSQIATNLPHIFFVKWIYILSQIQASNKNNVQKCTQDTRHLGFGWLIVLILYYRSNNNFVRKRSRYIIPRAERLTQKENSLIVNLWAIGTPTTSRRVPGTSRSTRVVWSVNIDYPYSPLRLAVSFSRVNSRE